MSKQIKPIAYLFFILVVFLMPLVYYSGTTDPCLTPRHLALSLILLLTTIVFLVMFRKHREIIDFGIKTRILLYAYGIYIIASLVSLVKSGNIAESLFDITRIFLGFGVFIFTLFILSNYKNTIKILSKFMLICGLSLGLLGLLQYYEIAFGFLYQAGLPAGTSANRNIFLAQIALILPFAVFGIFTFKKLWRIVSVLAFAIILFLVIVGASRSVMAAVALSIIISAVLYFVFRKGFHPDSERRMPRDGIIALIPITIVIAIIIISGFALKSGQRSLGDTISSAFSPHVASNRIRIQMWERSLQMYADNPVFGVGAGNWKIEVAAYGAVGPEYLVEKRFFQRPHNDYLWVLSEKGPVALLAYLAMFGIAIVYGIRIIKNPSLGEQPMRIFALCMTAGILIYMVDSFFSFPMERILNLIFVNIILGALVTVYSTSVGDEKRPGSGKPLFVVLTALLPVFTFSAIMGAVRLDSEIHIKLANAERAKGNWSGVIRLIDSAESAFVNLDPTGTPLAWYSGEAHFMRGEYDSAFTDYLRAYEHNPNHIHVLNNLATTYEMRGNHNRAIELYERAIAIHEDFDEAYINLAAAYYNAGMYHKADESLSKVDDDFEDERKAVYRQKIDEKLKSMQVR
jgi:O-antigen ligase